MTVVGLQWVQSTDTYSSPTGDSIGSLTPATRVAACNSISPWSGMTRCNLWDTGVQTATYGDRCYTDTDVANMGQAMVKIPKFWYATNHTGSPGSMTYRWYISSTGADSLPSGVGAWKVHPAFSRNSVTKAQIYLSAYEAYYDGVSKLESVAGVPPTDNTGYTIAQFRTLAEVRGAGWELQDYLTICATQLLYLLEYGKFDAQGVLGYGIMNDVAKHNTGETAGYGNASYGTANAATAMSYRGIENWYGNLCKVTDGINIKADRNPWVADHGFVSDTFTAPYTNTSLSLCTTNGFVSDITTSATYDYGFLATAVSGSVTTDLTDYYYQATGNMVAFHGGNYVAGGTYWEYMGPFVWGFGLASSYTWGPGYGTRLEYIG